MMKTPALIVVLSCTVLLSACGGGGGGPDHVSGTPALNLNGYWEWLTRTPSSGGSYELESIVDVVQNGSTVTFNVLECRLDGTSVTGAYPNFHSPSRIEFHLRAASADLMEGQSIQYGGASGPTYVDLLARRIPTPTGTFTATGATIQGPLDLRSTQAYAELEYVPPTIGVFDLPKYTIRIPRVEGSPHLMFTLSGAVPGSTYTIPHHLSLVFVRWFAGSVASAGTLTVASVSDDHISGSYAVTLDTGHTLSGIFDVDVLIRR